MSSKGPCSAFSYKPNWKEMRLSQGHTKQEEKISLSYIISSGGLTLLMLTYNFVCISHDSKKMGRLYKNNNVEVEPRWQRE